MARAEPRPTTTATAVEAVNVRTGAGPPPSGWTIGPTPLRAPPSPGQDRGMVGGILLVGRIHLDLGRLQSVALCR
jgi:hypothetical protein